MNKELRKVEVMVDGVGWTECNFGDVLEDDQFRLFEPTGEPVIDTNGLSEFVASKNAYKVEDTETWCLESKDED